MLLLLGLGLLAPTVAEAGQSDVSDERRLGVGLGLGDPSTVTGRFYMNQTTSIQIDLGWSTWGWGGVYVGPAWLYAPPAFYSQNGVDVRAHVGIGAFLVGDTFRRVDPLYLGPRVPVGVDFDLWDAPVQVFADFALAATVVPRFDLGFDLAIGGRYYF